MYKEKFDLSGRVAVVTGGAGGIGLEIGRALSECGAYVILADLSETAAVEAAASLSSSAEGRRLDVTRPVEVAELAKTIAARCGGVDILVNSAGIARITPALEADDEEWRLIMDVNLNGTFWCAREFGRLMVARGKGSIINLGSMSGSIVNRPQAATAYIASKAAVHMLTKSLACEWVGSNVRVNALAPGYIATEMTLQMRARPELFGAWLRDTPMGRCGEPHEVASAALFLASDAASYVTGSVIEVDGGYTAW
jgi:NAD(P)-dependent dehydrogenase (short-subunit alcohol dehydrogenase family)